MRKSILTMLTAMFMASVSMADLFTVDADTADAGIGVNTNGTKVLLWSGQTEQGVGDDNYTYEKAEQCAVLVFQLPDLGGETISSAELSLDYYNAWPGGGGTFPKHLMLCGSRYSSSSSVATSDYAYIDTIAGSLLQGDLATLVNENEGWLSTTTSTNGSAALANWLSAQYAAGATGNDYVFLTIAVDSNTANSVKIAMSEHTSQSTPVLQITTEAAVQPSTTNLTAHTDDMGWRSDGSSLWIGQPTTRIGSHTASIYTGLVIPFWIPDLDGKQVVGAELSVTIPDATGLAYATGAANVDVYGVRSSSSSTTASSDLTSGTQVVDDWFNINSSLSIGEKTVVSTNLAEWIDGQVGTNGGVYVFVTIKPDAIDGTYRYATINTANAPSNQPQLTLTLADSSGGGSSGGDIPLAADELAVDCNSLVNGPGTNWATAFQTIGDAVASSSFSATGRNIILVKEGTYREKINLNKSGVANTPLVIAQATTNDHVVLSGMKELDSWTQVSGSIYKNTQMGTNYVIKMYANDVKLPVAREPQTGWWASTSASSSVSGTVSTVTFTDTVNLQGCGLDLTGGIVEMWNRVNNIFEEFPIKSFNESTGTITFDGPATAWANLSSGLYYALMGTQDLMNQPGEWYAVDESGVNAVYMLSPNSGAPSGIESPYIPGPLLKVQNQSHIRFDGLDISGAGWDWNTTQSKWVEWNAHNLYVLTGEDIGVYNCISRYAENTGIFVRNVLDGEIANCISRRNHMGIAVQSSTNVTVKYNDCGYNKEDSLRMFDPNLSCDVHSNYIHHTTSWGHSDTMQIAGTDGVTNTYPMDLDIRANVILGGGQSTMTAATMFNTWANNIFYGCEAYMLILGHESSGYHDVINNTFGYSRYGNLRLTWTDYNVQSNIFSTGHNTPMYGTQECTNYWGDYNWFYPAPRETSPILLSCYDPSQGKSIWTSSLTTFQDATGQDLSSSVGDPGFSNAPVGIAIIDKTRLEECTTNTFVLSNDPKLQVGDYVEYDFDGILRQVTVFTNSDTIVVSPAVYERPGRGHLFMIWGSNTNLVPDVRSPQSAGSTVKIEDYQNGDFDGDGIRDLPEMPAYLD